MTDRHDFQYIKMPLSQVAQSAYPQLAPGSHPILHRHVDQFLKHRRRDDEAHVRQTRTDSVQGIKDRLAAGGQIQWHVAIYGDERAGVRLAVHKLTPFLSASTAGARHR